MGSIKRIWYDVWLDLHSTDKLFTFYSPHHKEHSGFNYLFNVYDKYTQEKKIAKLAVRKVSHHSGLYLTFQEKTKRMINFVDSMSV